MSTDIALSTEQYIIPMDQVDKYVSPETYQVSDPETGITWVYYNGEPVVELGRKKVLDNRWVHPEPRFQYGRCKMIKADGERCRQPVRPGWSVCKFHGAGSSDAPGGRPPETGRYSDHLPTRYFQDYQSYLADPNLLSMRNEMALLDVRIGELLERLETADSAQAWNRVAIVNAMLEKMLSDGKTESLPQVQKALQDAMTMHKDDASTWGQLTHMIETRRKVADVERRRIEAAKKYLTLSEANALLAFFTSAVMRNVSSPHERACISEELRKFAARGESQ